MTNEQRIAQLEAQVRRMSESHDQLAEAAKLAYAHNEAITALVIGVFAQGDEAKMKALGDQIEARVAKVMKRVNAEAATLAVANAGGAGPFGKPKLVN